MASESLTMRQARDAGARLTSLGRLAVEAGAEVIERECRELTARLAEGRFHLVCVGQFKRGKSTLLNALVDDDVLPAGVVPVTSAVTILRYGPVRGARVRFASGIEQEIEPGDVVAYVSESENSENRKGVRAVEVFLPSALLSEGMCLVDTPGLGSVFAGNAAVTREFVPHVDAALVVLGADPPISGEEMQLVEQVAQEVEHLVFVLNKADRLCDAERAEAARFTEEILSRRLGRAVGPVYEVSALERVQRGQPTRDWSALEAAIESLAHEAGADLVAIAEARGLERLAGALLREIAERHDALTRPVEQSERRIAVLRKYVTAAERALSDLGYLLSGEQARMAAEFRERQAAYFPQAQARGRQDLELGLRRIEKRSAIRREGFDLAQQIARSMLESWRAEFEPLAEDLYRGVTVRFVEHANEFLERLSLSGEPGSENVPRSLGPEAGFRVRSGVHYTELLYRTLSPVRGLTDRLRTREGVIRSVVRQVGTYLDDLVEANSSRIANDLVERVAQSRKLLEGEIRQSLRQVSAVAERALEEARRRRAEGEPAVRTELQRLDNLRRETEALLSPT
jgi:GTPase SAR1 family protein